MVQGYVFVSAFGSSNVMLQLTILSLVHLSLFEICKTIHYYMGESMSCYTLDFIINVHPGNAMFAQFISTLPNTECHVNVTR